MGVRGRMKGMRRKRFALTDEDRAILRLYAEVNDCTLRDYWEDRYKQSEYELVWSMTELYLDITRPNEVIEGTPEEKWLEANTTVKNMWDTVRPALIQQIKEDIAYEGSHPQPSGGGG